MNEVELNSQLLDWIPSLHLRLLLIFLSSALIYGLMTIGMRRLNSLITQRYRSTSPMMEPRIKSLNKLARIVMLAAIGLVDLSLILPQLGVDYGLIRERTETLTAIAIIMCIAILLYWLLLLVLGGLGHAVADEDDTASSELERRTETINTVLRSTGLVIIAATASMMILQRLGLDIGPIVAGAGIAGIAIGFGAQALVQDILSGFFILLEDQFRVGDFIRTGDSSGTVERMSLRSTWLRGIDGTLHVIPNGEIRTVSNRSKNWARVIIDVRIPYDEDIDRAEALLARLADEIVKEEAYAGIIEGEPSVLSVAELAESWVTLKILLMTSAGQQWAISRDLQKRIVKAFNQEDIHFAYPQSVVHVAAERPERLENGTQRNTLGKN